VNLIEVAPVTDPHTAVLLKQLLVQFSELHEEFKRLMRPVDIDDHPTPTRSHGR
jgi:hypothetical protein